jgi:hypothetical protein
MFAVNGIYDGKVVKITDKISEKKRYKVVVTFLEELQQTDNDIREFSAQTDGLGYLEDPRENIYQDYLKVKV